MATRILIADDAELVRIALRDLLKTENVCEIVEAENGKDAIRKALQTKPDLIILDMAMPVMDGLSATQEIKKRLPNTPILMYTLHYSAQLEAEARRVGVQKILPKSESTALLGAVRDMLERGKAEIPLAS